ncbi:hypothetical protein [Haloarchaeobius sp. DFWS5]|uniref:hypothetical protein n=1 Tax=Haloarchaeobius sp. DFWS5 TaxID=3446114 RepID=UPI003EBCCBE6
MPLLQLLLLVGGIVIEKTYVNRVTTFTGALALFVHVVVAGGANFWVGLYLDFGLVLGVLGLFAYAQNIPVNQKAVTTLAYFGYAPLTILVVIALPDWLFLLALLLGGAVSYQLAAFFDPDKPYYYGHPEEEREEGGVGVAAIVSTVSDQLDDARDVVEEAFEDNDVFKTEPNDVEDPS